MNIRLKKVTKEILLTACLNYFTNIIIQNNAYK